MIKNYKQFESLLNKLQGPSEDEMEKNLSDKSTDDKLFIYARQDYLKGIKEILDDYEKKGDNELRWSDLIIGDAVANGSMKVLKYLIEEKGASVDGHYTHNLENAASNDQPDVIEYLLSKGAKVDVNGNGPLWRAVSYGYYECTKLLLKAGAKVEDYILKKAKNQDDKIYKLLKEYE